MLRMERSCFERLTVIQGNAGSAQGACEGYQGDGYARQDDFCLQVHADDGLSRNGLFHVSCCHCRDRLRRRYSTSRRTRFAKRVYPARR